MHLYCLRCKNHDPSPALPSHIQVHQALLAALVLSSHQVCCPIASGNKTAVLILLRKAVRDLFAADDHYPYSFLILPVLSTRNDWISMLCHMPSILSQHVVFPEGGKTSS